MSLKIDELDFDNLSKSEKRYLRERPWLPQPPGDVIPEKTQNDWDEDDHETVGIAPSATQSGATTDSGGDDGSEGDEDGSSPTEEGDRDYVNMTVPQMKEICREREIPVSGTHAELVQRLVDFDEMVAADDDITED